MAAYERSREVVASAPRTVTGVSGRVDVGGSGKYLNLLVDVTASGGISPTLDLTVEWSDNGTRWAVAQPADSFAQITGVTTVTKQFAVKASSYRIRWTIGGTTPSLTFAISQYVTD